MHNLVQFVSRAEWDATKNLEAFIDLCKNQLTVFGSDLDWDSFQWEGYLNFTKVGVKSKGFSEKDHFADEFMDFAKAYFRYQQGFNPTGTKNESKALRCIEKALLQRTGKAFINELSLTDLDAAAVVARAFYAKGSAYHAGREIERLAKFVSANRLIPNDLSLWKNPINRAADTIQTGAKAKEQREKKLPSSDVLNAMAEIFANNPDDPKDIFTSSVFAMLMCAPSRISEVFNLPVDCEVEIPDKNGVVQYGWRFWSGKGFGGDIKWIPSVMVPIAKEAISRIKAITDPARKLAKWIEENPRKFYRHPDCPDVTAEQKLTAIEAASALGLGLVSDNTSTAQRLLSVMDLKTYNKAYTLDDLWNSHVIPRQPENFPFLSKEKGIKYSNALFCMTKNLLFVQIRTSPVILWAPNVNVFNNDLSPRESLNSDSHKSIFDRYGYKDAQGNRLKVTSHQIRHLLSTLAERGGMAQDELAKWAGRADAKHNRVYNQMSEYEMVVRAELFDPSKSLFGPVGEARKHIPITIQEFNTLEKGAAHVTEFGYCVHDYTISPCDKYRDCLNCKEQVCIKGEAEKLERIKFQLAEVEQQFSAAEKAWREGYAGADRWYEYHQHTLVHLRQLVEILEDDSLPDGSQIKLVNDKSFSHINRVLSKEKLKNDALNSDAQQQLISDLSDLLGGGLG
ncbi:MAG: integrase [Thiotrichales bacterium]|jgi:hypothetical protein|nr:integrase [Thiotrichales bacterium]